MFVCQDTSTHGSGTPLRASTIVPSIPRNAENGPQSSSVDYAPMDGGTDKQTNRQIDRRTE